MRERVKRLFTDYEKAVSNIKAAIKVAEDDLAVDGTIKRFELCYELAWKLMKLCLEDKGIICKNPRDCFKQAYLNDLIDNEETWIRMIEDRNLLVHTYTFEHSREVFDHIKEGYIQSFEHLYKKAGHDLSQDRADLI